MEIKEDYKEYFEQIAVIERDMVFRIHWLMVNTENNNVVRVSDDILKDEVKHYKYARTLLENYIYKDVAERKKFEERFSFGEVVVFLERETYVKARAVKVSDEGIGFESDEPLAEGAVYDLSITAKKDGTTHARRGTVSWMSEIEVYRSVGGSVKSYIGWITCVQAKDINETK